MNERLDKFLSNRNMGSRRDVAKAIKDGRVRISDRVITDPACKIDPDADEIFFDGTAVLGKQFIYILMNKPCGVLSASRDSKAETVLDLIPGKFRRSGLFPAGRLDRDTTGMLIITDDGSFAHLMLSPRRHVPKRYLAKLDIPVCAEDIEKFASGIISEGERFEPAELIPGKDGSPTAEVILHEGKFHEVKRLFHECGKEVVELERTAIGGLEMDKTLKRGECRLLDEKERMLIFNEHNA
jgi:16S rRNA pseudouridine516 synthase